jgi:hypothetical protein
VSVPDETKLLVAFARAAAKAQRIEALFQELLLAAEVAQDTRNRPFEDIRSKVERETLGRLTGRFLEIAQGFVNDPRHSQLWNEINDERIFLMHKFFNAFDVISTGKNIGEAAERLDRMNRLFDRGYWMLETIHKKTFATFNIPPDRLREFLTFVVETRKNRQTSR